MDVFNPCFLLVLMVAYSVFTFDIIPVSALAKTQNVIHAVRKPLHPEFQIPGHHVSEKQKHPSHEKRRFDGKSSYTVDYIPHPLEAQGLSNPNPLTLNPKP